MRPSLTCFRLQQSLFNFNLRFLSLFLIIITEMRTLWVILRLPSLVFMGVQLFLYWKSYCTKQKIYEISNNWGNLKKKPSVRAGAKILRAWASKHSFKFCEQIEQKSNFASTSKFENFDTPSTDLTLCKTSNIFTGKIKVLHTFIYYFIITMKVYNVQYSWLPKLDITWPRSYKIYLQVLKNISQLIII